MNPIKLAVSAAALLGLTACSAFLEKGNLAIDAYFKAKGQVQTKVVESTVLGLRVYCERNSAGERADKRAQFAAVADSKPETAGLRAEITCPDDANAAPTS